MPAERPPSPRQTALVRSAVPGVVRQATQGLGQNTQEGSEASPRGQSELPHCPPPTRKQCCLGPSLARGAGAWGGGQGSSKSSPASLLAVPAHEAWPERCTHLRRPVLSPQASEPTGTSLSSCLPWAISLSPIPMTCLPAVTQLAFAGPVNSE